MRKIVKNLGLGVLTSHHKTCFSIKPLSELNSSLLTCRYTPTLPARYSGKDARVLPERIRYLVLLCCGHLYCKHVQLRMEYRWMSCVTENRSTRMMEITICELLSGISIQPVIYDFQYLYIYIYITRMCKFRRQKKKNIRD